MFLTAQLVLLLKLIILQQSVQRTGPVFGDSMSVMIVTRSVPKRKASQAVCPFCSTGTHLGTSLGTHQHDFALVLIVS